MCGFVFCNVVVVAMHRSPESVSIHHGVIFFRLQRTSEVSPPRPARAMPSPAAEAEQAPSLRGLKRARSDEEDLSAFKFEAASVAKTASTSASGGGGSSTGAFSLKDEVARQAAASLASSPDDSAAKRSGKTIKHANAEEVTCRHCPGPAAKGQIRCWVHKRAFESIQVNTKKDGDKAEQELFKTTFGASRDDEGHIDSANLVLEKFLEKWPDGKVVKGKARGKDFKLSSVKQTQGFRREKKAFEQEPKWDFELFCNEMKMKRGWAVPRCRTEWDKLRADESIDRDMSGPSWSRECLQIPAWLTGMRSVEASDTAYEDKSLDIVTKLKAKLC